ncbi:MAG: tRNA (uridine(54)-C5)-methyltransferase TrmA [Gammaproteobacteria bacterium]|nr:tRNA (uridine(54)-C5)-methyltransferase TrmA [Gammaproteobacteria bacterium]
MRYSEQDYSAPACAALLEQKVRVVRDAMHELGAPVPEVHASPPRHYRQRAEFRFWHEGDDAFYAMFDPANPREPVRIDEFPPASQRINALMQRLRAAVLRSPALARKLFQVEFLSTLANEALVVLVYHRPLDAAWEDAARELSLVLDAQLIGRSRGQRIVIGESFVTERLQVDGRELVLRQPEGCFTQPNAEVNRAMLSWARAGCGGAHGGLLELYCGIGNFTVALADRFDTVLATEINKAAIAAAGHNLAANGIDNTFIARLSSAEASAALARERPFRRLRDFDLDRFDPGTVLVDPPRAGLDARTLAQVAGFGRIVYISCNPQTLRENLVALAATHDIERFALFDQFPYTHHLECGVTLQRRNAT